MNQVETENEILEISLAELKSRGIPGEKPQGGETYLVVESEYEDCLLKKVPQLKGTLVLRVNPKYNSWRVFGGVEYKLVVESWWRNRDSVKKIKLTSDKDVKVTVVKPSSSWGSKNFQIDFGHSFHASHSVSDCSVVDEGETISLGFANEKFSVEEVLSDYEYSRLKENGIMTVTTAVYAANSLPVNKKRNFH